MYSHNNTPHITKLNSTIFKTINDSVDNTKHTLTIFNKDWNTYKANWQKGFSQNGIFGGIKSIFQSSSTSSLKEQMQILRTWNNAVKMGCTNQATFDRIIANANDNTKMYFASLNKGKGSIEGLKNAQNATKLSTIGLTITQTALNAAIGMGIGLLTNLVIKEIDSFVHASENAKNKSNELFSTLESANDSLASQKDLIDHVKNNYEKFSNGVNSLGENISLSKQDFEEYHSICNQIAEYYPQMVSAWDKEGNAIVNLTDKVNDLETAYKDARTASLNEFVENADDVVESYKLNADYSSKSFFDKAPGYKQQIAALHAYLDVIQNVDKKEQALAINDLVNNGGKGFSGSDLSKTYKIFNLSKYEPDQLPDYLNGVIKNLETKLAQEDNSMKQMLLNMFSLDSNDYSDISEEAYLLGTTYINSLDSSFFENKNIGDYRNFTNNLLKQLTGENAGNIISTFHSLSNLDKEKSNLSVSEYEKRLESLTDDLKTYLEIDEDIATAIISSQLGEDASDFSNIDIMTNNVKDKLQDTFDNKVNELTLDELQIAANLDISDKNLLSWDKLKAKIEETKKARNDSQSDFDIMSNIASLSKGLEQLDKIYDDVCDKGDFDWLSIINNDEFADTFKKCGDVYTDFTDTILKNSGDIEACQAAFDNLTTSYIEQSGVLDNITDSTKDMAIAYLEQMGITNAEEIVMNRLALQQEFTIGTSQNLADATLGDVAAFIQNTTASDSTKQSIAMYAIQKEFASGIHLNTESDVLQLINLISVLGGATNSLQFYYTLLQSGYNVNSPIINGAMIAAQNQAQTEIDKIKNRTPVQAIQSVIYPTIKANKRSDRSGRTNDSGRSGGAGGSGGNLSPTPPPSIETFDFIEKLIDRQEKKIEKYNKKAEDATKSFSTRMRAYKLEIKAVSNSINLLNSSYDTYMDRANKVGLEEDWAAQVRDGSLNIADVTDDGLKNRISEYQKWYDKAKSVKDKLDELKQKQEELNRSKIELILTKYEKQLEKFSKANDLIESKIGVKEARGGFASKDDYSNMNKNIRSQISYTIKSNAELRKLQKTVKEGSEEWQEYQERIDSNNISLQKLKQNITDNAKAAAELARKTADKRIEKYDSKDDLYEAKKENATSASAKNKQVKNQMSNVDKRQKENQTAYDESKKTLNASKKSINKLKNKKATTKDKADNKANKTYNKVLKQVKSTIK
ncbi:MAG: hypothetical protein HFI37_09470, partial [Lachnospiraceae bacterium]|nr:hypothetical protein [Lachnospiraceae bacterium]